MKRRIWTILWVFACSTTFVCGQSVSNVTIDGVAVTATTGNYHARDGEFQICWSFQADPLFPTDVQTNWQVQVDTDTNPNDAAFFWMAHAGSKPSASCLGQSNTQTCALVGGNAWRDCDDPLYQSADASAAINPDRRHAVMYIRIRVCGGSDPANPACTSQTSTSWGAWATFPFSRNHPPYWPSGLAAAADLVTSSFPTVTKPARVSSPRTMYVGTDTTGMPACTAYLAGTCGDDPSRPFNRGLALATQQLTKGDTLKVLPGVYSGVLHELAMKDTAANTPWKAGEESNPITVKASCLPNCTSGQKPILAGVSGSSVAWSFNALTNTSDSGNCLLHHWIFDGLTVQMGSSVVNGLRFVCANNVLVGHFEIDSGSTAPTYPPNDTVTAISFSGADSFISDSYFNYATDHIEAAIAGGTIVGNEFTNSGRHSIQQHGTAWKPATYEANWWHDVRASADGALFFYLDSNGLAFRNNIIENVKSTNDGPYGITLRRGGGALIENNVLYGMSVNNGVPSGTTRGYRGILSTVGGGWTWIRNNVFLDWRDYPYSTSDGNGIGSILDYNVFRTFYGKLTNPSLTGSCPGSALNCNMLHAAVGNCTTDSTSCDPGFVSLGSLGPPVTPGDFKASSLSSIMVNTGDPATIVPAQGAPPRDRGRFEWGAPTITQLGTYDDTVQASFNDSTPKFTWTNQDFDKLMKDTIPIPTAPSDLMTAFEVQIDTGKRFNSWDGLHPLFSSGKVVLGVPSDSGSYTVPAANALTVGTTYYARVRTWDSFQTAYAGAWSVPVRFKITSNPPLCYSDYCVGEGVRCVGTGGGGGCCYYEAQEDPTCLGVDPLPPNACGCF